MFHAVVHDMNGQEAADVEPILAAVGGAGSSILRQSMFIML